MAAGDFPTSATLADVDGCKLVEAECCDMTLLQAQAIVIVSKNKDIAA